LFTELNWGVLNQTNAEKTEKYLDEFEDNLDKKISVVTALYGSLNCRATVLYTS
jgi:hypothetical protein